MDLLDVILIFLSGVAIFIVGKRIGFKEAWITADEILEKQIERIERERQKERDNEFS